MNDVEFVGPFEHHDVVVHGRRVPHLSATPLEGGAVALHLDRRHGLDVPAELVRPFVFWIADALAVAHGFASHPHADGEPIPLPWFPKVIELGSLDGLDPEPRHLHSAPEPEA